MANVIGMRGERTKDTPLTAVVTFSSISGGEGSLSSAYPHPTVAALLVTEDGRQIGAGRSDFQTEAIQACLTSAGLEITPLSEWIVSCATLQNWHS